jgi:hypothetical protein
MRVHTLEKVRQFLFLSGKSLPLTAFTSSNEELLREILKLTWVIDSSEKDFYIQEFRLCREELDKMDLLRN